MRFMTRSLVALLCAALALAFLGFAALTVQSALSDRAERAQMPRMARERVFTARVVPVEAQRVAPVLTAFGEVRARRMLELRAPASGRVLEIAGGVESGAAVQAGQWLIRLDPAEPRSARDLAQADLERAEADLRDAARSLELARLDRAEAEAQADLRRRAFERREALSARGVASETAIEEAELAYAGARATVIARRQSEAQAEARLESAGNALARQQITLSEAERRLAETEIVALFDGVLGDVTALPGGLVSANERLASVIDPAALEVRFRLSTAQYLRLLDAHGALISAEGEAALELGGLEVSSALHLSRASAEVGEGQTGRLLYAELLHPRGFRPGDFVTVRLAEPELEAVALIPAGAIDAEGRVLVLGADDRLEAATASIVRRQGQMVLISAPELEGREIVAARTPLLGAGIRIRPQRDEPGADLPAAGAATDSAVPVPQAEAPAARVILEPDRRAALIARVEGNAAMPAPVRTRILAQLAEDEVPLQLIERLEAAPRGG